MALSLELTVIHYILPPSLRPPVGLSVPVNSIMKGHRKFKSGVQFPHVTVVRDAVVKSRPKVRQKMHCNYYYVVLKLGVNITP